jgi:hypothetical protein
MTCFRRAKISIMSNDCLNWENEIGVVRDPNSIVNLCFGIAMLEIYGNPGLRKWSLSDL